MGQNFWMAIVAWSFCFVLTVVMSLATRAHQDRRGTRRPGVFADAQTEAEDEPWYQRPVVLGVMILAATLVLNIIFA